MCRLMQTLTSSICRASVNTYGSSSRTEVSTCLTILCPFIHYDLGFKHITQSLAVFYSMCGVTRTNP